MTQRLSQFRPGSWVMYQKPKSGSHPTPRAKDVHPSTSGETYEYSVDKFWRVEKVTEQGQIVVKTRTGKQHIIPVDDPRLRRARWWEIMLHRRRFIIATAAMPAESTKISDESVNDT